ncbi:MAG: hypothetical protein V7L25_31620 [Nostoc sp.]|uniref:hypothetical protein n=1 Tax=Nostoc sp. TaxID=1180 RepID=UPI002FEEBD22
MSQCSIPEACHPKRRGDYPETPAIRLSFPSLSMKTAVKVPIAPYLQRALRVPQSPICVIAYTKP